MSTITLEAIVFYLLLIDAISCNFLVLFGSGWYLHHFRTISRWFPPAEGWALYYLVLVLWAGSFLWRMGALGF